MNYVLVTGFLFITAANYINKDVTISIDYFSEMRTVRHRKDFPFAQGHAASKQKNEN